MMVGQKVGPFHIEKDIGSGAMGTVYRARFDKDGKPIPVALKVIALGLLGNEGAMARFERETEILKQLRHKHIVRLIAFGRYKQTPFIAMEFIDGEALDRVLTRRNRMAWEDVVEYGKQLCDALQYAHDKGILHRDLKPSNLMVTKDGSLKLTDFGIAKDMDVTALTGQNSTIGTAAYMSPEQCRGERLLTNKSDLYSLGVVLYELLTGKKPFNAETTVDMFLKHVNEKPVRPSKYIPDLPIWLDNLVMFLLEKDKDRRPLDAQTVGKMLAEIEEKVRTQHSAGADVANARRIDRPFGENELDETDREAARTLRTGGKTAAKPKKVRAKAKKGRPLSERAWLKAIPLVAVLGVIVFVLYTLLKPGTQDDLFNAWKTASTPDAKLDRAERYLSRFGTDGSEQTEQVRASMREIRGERLQAILDKRFRNRNAALKITTAQEGEDEQAHSLAWSGLEAEDKGDMPLAIGFWNKLKAHAPGVTDRYGDGWLWLAEKHLSDIGSLDRKLKEVRDEVLRAQDHELEWKYDPTQADSVAKLAVRLDSDHYMKGTSSAIDRPPLTRVKDPPKTRKAWAALAELTKGKTDQSAWHLLATRERDRYPEVKSDQALADRVKMLNGVLAAAEREWARVGSNPDLLVEQRDCRNRCRDIAELYRDDPDPPVKLRVERAEELLKKMQPPG